MILLRAILFLAVVLVSGLSSSAQRVAFYGTYAFTHVGSVESGIVQTGSGLQNEYGSLNSSGFGGGATLYLFHLPGVAIGLDTHGATRTGVNNFDDALFGVKLSATRPLLHVKPYIGGGAGFMKTLARNTSNAASGFTTTIGGFAAHYDFYQAYLGLDYPLKRALDIRLIEVGAGSSFGRRDNVSVTSINTGIVLHF